MMPTRTALLITALTAVLGCSQTPVLEGTQSEMAQNAPFPVLLPRAELLAGQSATPQITAANIAGLNARLTGLRTRAARLHGPVIDPQTRTKLRRAIARAALR